MATNALLESNIAQWQNFHVANQIVGTLWLLLDVVAVLQSDFLFDNEIMMKKKLWKLFAFSVEMNSDSVIIGWTTISTLSIFQNQMQWFHAFA